MGHKFMKETICDPCGKKLGNKIPTAATWHAGVCDYCGEKNYVTEPRDFGIYEEDEDVENLKNLFGMK